MYAGSGGAIELSTLAQNYLSGTTTQGGAIYAAGPLSLRSSSLISNGAAEGTAVFGSVPDGLVSLQSSIVVSSYFSEVAPCAGSISSLGNNLTTTEECDFDPSTDQVTAHYQGPDYPSTGTPGSPPVLSISSSSPAVDAGVSFGQATDQLGHQRIYQTPYTDRPGSDGADIGAFEAQAFFTCMGREVTIANRFDDPDPLVVEGTDGDDVIMGGPDRVIRGGDGDDVICGGYRTRHSFGVEETILGGEGDDVIDGMSGNDKLRGQAGNDVLLGNTGYDRLYGWTGDDTLKGGEGDDHLIGGPDSDLCRGNSGLDKQKSCELPARSGRG